MLIKNMASRIKTLIIKILDKTILEKQPTETKLQIIETLVKKSPIHIKDYDNLLILSRINYLGLIIDL
jgi:hypothetical protein